MLLSDIMPTLLNGSPVPICFLFKISQEIFFLTMFKPCFSTSRVEYCPDFFKAALVDSFDDLATSCLACITTLPWEWFFTSSTPVAALTWWLVCLLSLYRYCLFTEVSKPRAIRLCSSWLMLEPFILQPTVRAALFLLTMFKAFSNTFALESALCSASNVACTFSIWESTVLRSYSLRSFIFLIKCWPFCGGTSIDWYRPLFSLPSW